MPDCNAAILPQYAGMMTTASTMRPTAPRPRLWSRLFGPRADPMGPLYDAIVTEARLPGWYLDCGVPDTVDGRFDMLALVLSVVLLRFERDGDARAEVRLTERFIDDMDGQMRQTGFGDLVVGKQVGGIMAALGGRLGAYRGGIGRAALVRNLWRGAVPTETVIAETLARIALLEARIGGVPHDALLAGQLE